jgi:transcriptional regulator with XRE-family HTH domain
MSLYSEIGAAIREARDEAGITQKELADRAGMSRASIANIEAGRQQFPLHVLYRIARALDVDATRLLPAASQDEALPPVPAKVAAWVEKQG